VTRKYKSLAEIHPEILALWDAARTNERVVVEVGDTAIATRLRFRLYSARKLLADSGDTVAKELRSYEVLLTNEGKTLTICKASWLEAARTTLSGLGQPIVPTPLDRGLGGSLPASTAPPTEDHPVDYAALLQKGKAQ
jgi:hypothetical protein